MSRTKKTTKKEASKILNVKFPESDYETLKQIAHELGDVSLSSMIRMLIYNQLNKYEKSGDAKDFLDMK